MKKLESILNFLPFVRKRNLDLKSEVLSKASRYKIFSIWETLIFVFCVIFTLLLLLFFFNDSSLNTKGIKALKRADFQMAQKYFKQNIEKGSLNSFSYLNLGLSYDLLNQSLKALEIYEIVSNSKNKDAGAFFSYFNQAELYGRLRNLESALRYYQSAIEFGRKEKEIKTNIELLFKQKEQNSSDQDQPEKNKGEGQKDSSGQNQFEKNQAEGQKDSSDQDQSEKDKGGEQKDGSGQDQPDKDKEGKQKDGSGQGQSQQKKEESSKANNNEGDTANNEKQAEQKNTDSKALTEREQKAILEEVEKQESKVRAKIYQNKHGFGDKTKEDW